VIAIILLLMMAVATAGGAYVWLTSITEQAQEDAETSLATRVEAVGIQC
jgi:flagellar basal body-associated protein FliL